MSNDNKENYYKILGTTANISNRRIKEKYIQAVKEHPPETDPEGFEKVRRAYETLKNPEKRKQYDLMRKYGGRVDKLLDKAWSAIDEEDYRKATELLQQAAKIDPDNLAVTINLMMITGMDGNFTEMEQQFDKAIDNMEDSEEKIYLYLTKARMFSEFDDDDKALAALEEGRKKFPDHVSQFSIAYSSTLAKNGQLDEAWEVINAEIPSEEEETPEDIHKFIAWVNCALHTDRWSVTSKIQSRFRKFLKNLTDEEDKQMAADELSGELWEMYESADFREAAFYAKLLKVVEDYTDQETKGIMGDAKDLARIQKETDRVQHDEDMFPLVSMHIFEFFYGEFLPEEKISMMMAEVLPQSFADEMKEYKEEYAAGIIRLRKKYPLLYKRYKTEWDNLFADLTKDFNREMKRSLR